MIIVTLGLYIPETMIQLSLFHLSNSNYHLYLTHDNILLSQGTMCTKHGFRSLNKTESLVCGVGLSVLVNVSLRRKEDDRN